MRERVLVFNSVSLLANRSQVPALCLLYSAHLECCMITRLMMMMMMNAEVPDAWLTNVSVAIMGLNVLVTIAAGPLIEKWGRKKLLIFGALGQCLALAPAAVACYMQPGSETASTLAVFALLGYVGFFAIAMGPVVWVYINEIYPPEVKGAASGFASAVNWMCTV